VRTHACRNVVKAVKIVTGDIIQMVSLQLDNGEHVTGMSVRPEAHGPIRNVLKAHEEQLREQLIAQGVQFVAREAPQLRGRHAAAAREMAAGAHFCCASLFLCVLLALPMAQPREASLVN
jgi:hypothetical protein